MVVTFIVVTIMNVAVAIPSTIDEARSPEWTP
jgi:hypothetical protein